MLTICIYHHRTQLGIALLIQESYGWQGFPEQCLVIRVFHHRTRLGIVRSLGVLEERQGTGQPESKRKRGREAGVSLELDLWLGTKR